MEDGSESDPPPTGGASAEDAAKLVMTAGIVLPDRLQELAGIGKPSPPPKGVPGAKG